MSLLPGSAEDRFFEKVVEDGDCWRWTASLHGGGYGNFWNGTKHARAHRWCWEFFLGEIPAGLQLDHLCRNRWCVKPWHLDPVTQSVNMRRAPVKGQPRKTFCKHGHEIALNEYIRTDGFRRCRLCLNASQAAYKARRKAGFVDSSLRSE